MPPSLRVVVRQHLAALRMLLLLSVITGVAYPLVITGIAQAGLADQANGSLIEDHGRTVGSSLIGQNFLLPKRRGEASGRPDPQWFQPRPSAAGDAGYDPTSSGASNLGPNNADLVTSIRQRRAAVAAFDGVAPDSVPADALTSSGSGLDPDISKAYARQQIGRVARTRGLSVATVRALVDAHVIDRAGGFLGEDGVNVVQLNHALAGLR